MIDSKRKKIIKKIALESVQYVVLAMIAIVLIFPFLWTLSSSLNTETANISSSLSLIPEGSIMEWRWQNYTKAMEIMNFWTVLKNTLIITIPKLFGDVIISALVAYGFARFEFKGKRFIFLILLASLVIPFEVTMIPLYIMYSKIGWIDTFNPLIVPAFFGAAQFIFFLTMYFITMPRDLISAAKMDGLSDIKIFTKLYLPLSMPALIVVSIWSFQGSWNDLLGPLIWLQSADKFTLQLSLASISNTTTYFVEKGVIMAATVLIMLPLLLLFICLQRYILETGKTSGIKG